MVNYSKLETFQVYCWCTFIRNSIYQTPIKCSITILWLPFRVVGGSYEFLQFSMHQTNTIGCTLVVNPSFFSWTLTTTVVLIQELFYVHCYQHGFFTARYVALLLLVHCIFCDTVSFVINELPSHRCVLCLLQTMPC